MLVGFDEDLADEATRISNRIRGLLTCIHPALERVVGPRISHPAVLENLTRCGVPNGISKAGKRELANLAVKCAPRMGARLADQIIAALSTQTGQHPAARPRRSSYQNLPNPYAHCGDVPPAELATFYYGNQRTTRIAEFSNQ